MQDTEKQDQHINCYHCGGQPKMIHGMQDGWVACTTCGATGPRRSSDEDAWAAWDKRSYPSHYIDEYEHIVKYTFVELFNVDNPVLAFAYPKLCSALTKAKDDINNNKIKYQGYLAHKEVVCLDNAIEAARELETMLLHSPLCPICESLMLMREHRVEGPHINPVTVEPRIYAICTKETCGAVYLVKVNLERALINVIVESRIVKVD